MTNSPICHIYRCRILCAYIYLAQYKNSHIVSSLYIRSNSKCHCTFCSMNNTSLSESNESRYSTTLMKGKTAKSWFPHNFSSDRHTAHSNTHAIFNIYAPLYYFSTSECSRLCLLSEHGCWLCFVFNVLFHQVLSELNMSPERDV